MTCLVGERFMCTTDGSWIDLATGRRVIVGVRTLDADSEGRESRLLNARRGPAPDAIDGGRLGTTRWFEVHDTAPAVEPRGPGRDDEVRSILERVASVAETAGPGVTHVRVGRAGEGSSAAGAIARRLRMLGFVTVRAGLPAAIQCLEALAHRHVALVVLDDCDRQATATWLQRLCRVSVRAHLLLTFDAPARPPRLAAARERAPAWHGEGQAAVTRLATLQTGAEHATVAAQLAGVLLARGDMARAEAVLSAALAADAIEGSNTGPALRVRAAELRFWQGRYEEAAAFLDEPASSLDALVVAGLTAWARADERALARAIAAVPSWRDSDSMPFWQAALSVLAAKIGGRALHGLVERLTEAARTTRLPCHVRLGRAVAAEALAFRGCRTEALRALGTSAWWSRAPPRDVLLFEWMRARIAGTDCSRLLVRIGESDLAGIKRWGAGSQHMHLLHAIPEVLELVHDAEDEVAALNAGCRWIRRACGAEAVAILSNEGTMVSASGWSARDTSALNRTSHEDGCRAEGRMTSPIRYAGVRIGSVVVRGTEDRSRTFDEAGRLVASLVAPALRARLDALAAAQASRSLAPEILGRSPAILSLKETIGRAASTPFAILIEGESGTGKELVARAIHRLSPRRDRRFSAVNCAALTDELVEAELFGHARGAFTGAVGPRPGLFEDAHAGSLFLDEVAELSPRAQAKLLRVLQEREVRRVGENAPRPVDVRLIAATNQPLGEAVRRGAFREDLLFRVAVVRIRLPPLRDRIEDIPVLADACWRKLTAEAGKRAVVMPDALAALCRHRWPGNVREFQNVMAALVVLAPEKGRISARHVAQVIEAATVREGDDVTTLEHVRARSERRAVAVALARHGGRRAPAARDLGLTRQGLAKVMKRLGLITHGEAGVA